MNNEAAQDRTVVLAVVVMLGLVALVGLVGGMYLIHEVGGNTNADSLRTEAAQVAVVFTTVGGATGALAGILASTRSAPPVPVQQAYQKGVDDLAKLAEPVPPVSAPTPPTMNTDQTHVVTI